MSVFLGPAPRPRKGVSDLTDHLGQRGRLHVQHDGALLDARAEFHQAVEGQRGHVGLAPALSTLLHLLLELDPPGRGVKRGTGLVMLLPPARMRRGVSLTTLDTSEFTFWVLFYFHFMFTFCEPKSFFFIWLTCTGMWMIIFFL